MCSQYVLTNNISQPQQGTSSLIIQQSWNGHQHGQWISALTIFIIWIFFTPQWIRLGWSTRSRNGNHNAFLKQVGSHKDKENIVKKGNHQQNTGNLNGIELNQSQKDNAHTCPQYVLRDPKKGNSIRVMDKECHVQPCHAPGVSNDNTENVPIGDIPKFGTFVDETLFLIESDHEFGDQWTNNDLNDGIAASNGVHDLDDIVNLQ